MAGLPGRLCGEWRSNHGWTSRPWYEDDSSLQHYDAPVMTQMNSQPYPAPIAQLLDPQRVMELTFGKPNAAVRNRLEALDRDAAFSPQRMRHADMAACVLAGLWLLHDHMDESHAICQDIQTPSGSYWHGILHRREADYGNAKYWFRRVGEHPIFPRLRDAAASLASGSAAPGASCLATQSSWDAYKFIDLCETAVSSSDPALQQLCRDVQMAEFNLLLEYCYQQAIA